jgi:hypothetical protein
MGGGRGGNGNAHWLDAKKKKFRRRGIAHKEVVFYDFHDVGLLVRDGLGPRFQFEVVCPMPENDRIS